MNKAIQFSVLMSVYKKEKPEYLIKCIESIKEQTIQADEIIFVCDGPLTLELDQIIDNFKNKNVEQVTVKRFKENRGLGYSLADGVELAKYDWIARMDTDDIAREDRFAKQTAYINTHPEVSIIGSNIVEFSQTPDEPHAERNLPATHAIIYEFAKRRNPFNHMTVMFNKKAVLGVGNYQPMPGYEDFYLWVRMLKNGAIAGNIQENLVYARADEAMYERRGGWQYFKDGIKAYNTIYKVGLATPIDYIVRLFGQAVINLVPNKVRSVLYQKILRR